MAIVKGNVIGNLSGMITSTGPRNFRTNGPHLFNLSKLSLMNSKDFSNNLSHCGVLRL